MRAVYAILAVVIVVPMWKLIAGREILFLLDCICQHYPFQAILQGILDHDPGSVPLWDPYLLSGTPLLADPQRHVCYPPAILYRFLPFASGFGCFLAVHLLVAGVGAAVLLRSRGTTALAASLGAIAFSLGASASVQLATPPVLASYCWLPWIAIAALRLARNPGAVSACALGLLYAWLALAGYPPCVIFAGVLILIILAVNPNPRAEPLRRTMMWAGAALTVALAAGACVYLPFMGYLPSTDRGTRLPLDVALIGTLKPGDLAGLLSPFSVFSADGSEVIELGACWTRLHFVGVLTLALAVCGIVMSRDRRGIVSPLALLAAGITLALGPRMPGIGRFLLWFTPMSWMRHSGLWMGLAELGICWLAAVGLDIMIGQLAKPRGAKVLAAWLCASVFLGSMAGTSGLLSGWIQRNWGEYASLAAGRAGALFHPAIVLGLGVLLFWLARSREIAARTAGAGIVAVTALELLALRAAIQPATSARELMTPGYSESFLAQRSAADGWFRVFVTPRHQKRLDEEADALRDLSRGIRESLRSNLTGAAGFRDAFGDNPLKPAALERLYERAVWGPTHTLRRPWDKPALETFDMLGVKYLITRGRWHGPGYRLAHDGHVQIYEREGAVRPVWIEPRDAGRLVLVNSPRPGEWRIEVVMNGPGRMIVSENWLSGWRMEVGPEDSHLEPYRGALLSAILPAGRHELRLRYAPRSATAGLIVSSAILLALLAAGSSFLVRGRARLRRLPT